MLTSIPSLSMRYQTLSYRLLDGYARPSFGMDNLRDLVANVEFLGRKSITSHNHDIIMTLIPYHRFVNRQPSTSLKISLVPSASLNP
ncbi:unnamed protein product [Spirodela intermedia]|uniref:Uncharacterized protein n=1 Tax=Spirodela intermedia TaxID=51605 RepID=A0A7I8JM72_SPIIN|nr:unnamed protein product [Spirodela intermedia]CAA6671234.1 unnamed protein product [Spirodela intermedia]